jgi:hypothetical protein
LRLLLNESFASTSAVGKLTGVSGKAEEFFLQICSGIVLPNCAE